MLLNHTLGIFSEVKSNLLKFQGILISMKYDENVGICHYEGHNIFTIPDMYIVIIFYAKACHYLIMLHIICHFIYFILFYFILFLFFSADGFQH